MIPLRHTVEVARLVTKKNRLGEEHQVAGNFEGLKVAGWAINDSEESADESVLRTVDTLTLYSPTKLDPATTIRLPDATTWSVQGEAKDYRQGPWWDPGMYVITATRTTG